MNKEDQATLAVHDLRNVNQEDNENAELAKALRRMNRKEKRAFIRKLRKNVKKL